MMPLTSPDQFPYLPPWTISPDIVSHQSSSSSSAPSTSSTPSSTSSSTSSTSSTSSMSSTSSTTNSTSSQQPIFHPQQLQLQLQLQLQQQYQQQFQYFQYQQRLQQQLFQNQPQSSSLPPISSLPLFSPHHSFASSPNFCLPFPSLTPPVTSQAETNPLHPHSSLNALAVISSSISQQHNSSGEESEKEGRPACLPPLGNEEISENSVWSETPTKRRVSRKSLTESPSQSPSQSPKLHNWDYSENGAKKETSATPTQALRSELYQEDDHTISYIKDLVATGKKTRGSLKGEEFKTEDGFVRFRCVVANCDKTFSRNEHFKRHLMTHTKERPFVCSTCGRSFSRNDNLAGHVKKHSYGSARKKATARRTREEIARDNAKLADELSQGA